MTVQNKNKVLIIGGGPAGLMCAYALAKKSNAEIHLFDAQKTFGRKLMVAGHGGFNISHGEAMFEMIPRYKNIPPKFEYIFQQFNNQHTIDFFEKELDIPTYIGTSKRIFPQKGIKPATVLKVWLTALKQMGVIFHYNTKMIDFNQESFTFEKEGIRFKESYDQAYMSLGGISWKKTGSDGNWINLFESKGIDMVQFESSNVGLNINFPDSFRSKYEREAIKYVKVKVGGFEMIGDLMLTEYGLEGTPIYAANNTIRNLIHNRAHIFIDFKPNTSLDRVLYQLEHKNKNTSRILKEDLKLSNVSVDLIKAYSTKKQFQDNKALAKAIKNLPVAYTKLRPIDEAISSAGGVKWSNLDMNFSLKKLDKIYLGGEMLNWDAPTGGYLLQACFSMGYVAAKNIHSKLKH